MLRAASPWLPIFSLLLSCGCMQTAVLKTQYICIINHHAIPGRYINLPVVCIPAFFSSGGDIYRFRPQEN